ncbi:ABC transporter permease [Ectobacillus panaciterrae]|uniref:ABC transporter permease n=1 Tax=Ectobacillus panaciterrae TaxID=363872 RepID=UPI00040C8174|nr:ABC transporter permease [Ectobacillus panaciterrae]
MKSLIIAWKDFTIRFTDRRGFMTMILMPLLLTAILGTALAKTMGSDDMPKTTVGYYQEDSDALANDFRKDVLQGEELRDFITVKEASSRTELESMIKDGKADVGLVIPSQWSEKLKEGELKEASLITDPGKSLQSTIIESVMSSFLERVKTISVSANTAINDLAKSTPVMTGKVNMGEAAKDISKQLQDIASLQNTSVKEEAVGKKVVTSMQYYAAGMGVMFLLFNATIGAKMIVTERATETLARLLSTPTSALSILVGKFLGTLLFSIVQFAIFLAATRYGFGVDWGDNIAQTAVVGLAYAVCVSGLSMALAAMIRSEKTAEVISGVGIQLLALLGGSMLPVYVFSDTMKQIANIAPNKWALMSFLDIMGGTSWQNLLPALTVLLAIGAAALLLGTWRLRVK